MASQPIRYFDRYAQSLKTEKIYGGRWLRWAYENPVGRFAVWMAIRRSFFSQWYAWRMNLRYSDLRIIQFISEYGVNVDEFVKSPFDFKTFNEFFFRALKPEARPIAAGDEVAVLPADGRHLAFADLDAADGYYVKGAKFSLAELFGATGTGSRPDNSAGGADALAAIFAGGAMLISRLCPSDYHRFHFPVAGIPGEPRLVIGWLYSVSPIALRRNIRYVVENKRVVTLVESPVFGSVALIEVGATNVGSIRQTFVPGRAVAKGEEKGLFAFGGSCVITIFQRGRIVFAEDLVRESAGCIETYARMGDRLGVAARAG